MIATLINALAVLLGSVTGLFLKGRIHDQYEQTVFTALGCFTLVLGISMAQEPCNPLFMVFSLVMGGLLGTWLRIEDRIVESDEALGDCGPSSVSDQELSATVVYSPTVCAPIRQEPHSLL